MSRIFISYKRVDKDKVFKIKDQIESALGEKCWIDLDGIESDAIFASKIIGAINSCEVFLFMYSKAHMKITDYENDWTIRELNFAQDKKKRIVFVNIDESELSDWFKLLFATKQHIDGTSYDSIERLKKDLINWFGVANSSVFTSVEPHDLKSDLLSDMRLHPYKYHKDSIKLLFNGAPVREFFDGDNIWDKFLRNGGTIEYKDLINEHIIPESISEDKLLQNENFSCTAYCLDDYDDYSEDRTDVMFLGIPGCGKTSIMAGIVHEIFQKEGVTYIPNTIKGKKEPGNALRELVQCVKSDCFPLSTMRDQVGVVQFNYTDGKTLNKFSFVDIAGEAFFGMDDPYSVVRKILARNNKKILFFVVDYGLISGLHDRSFMTKSKQEALLMRTLDFLTADAIDTIAILISKSDLMRHENKEDCMNIATTWLNECFRGFIAKLQFMCNRFGINKDNGYSPYIFTFSVGKCYIGNSYTYNPNDSEELAQFILKRTKPIPQKHWWQIWKHLK